VSSHLLSEVQHTADRVAILSRGRSVAAGPVAQVLSAGRSQGLILRVADLTGGLQALRSAGFDAAPTDHAIRVSLSPSHADRVTRALADRGFYLTDLRPDEADLETVFLELTSDAGREGSR
jgi:ABC-2 type transport system ATP-binding protein